MVVYDAQRGIGMTAFLVIILIIGNLLLISGSMFEDLSDNGTAWFIVIAAIAMDCYFIYKIIQSVSESHEKKRLADAIQKVNQILDRYSPSKMFSIKEAKKIDIDPSLVNKEVVLCVKEYKNSISFLLQQSSKVNVRLMSILSCAGYTTAIEKSDYLTSKLSEIEGLKNESDELIKKISNIKIEILNEDNDLLLFLQSAFLSLLHSKKCVLDSLSINDVISSNTPNDLDLFKFKYTPPVLFVNKFYYCLFSNVVLVFDENGIFSTAVDPSALSVTLNKQTERVLVSNGYTVRQDFTDTDSKLIQRGSTRTTWTYTRNDGLPDRRYSYNPQIEYRSDDYEYGIIVFSVANSSLTMKVSSQTAITIFSTFSEMYIRKCNNLHNPIPDLLLLLKCISDDEDSNLGNIIEAINRSALQKNYFCRQINN